MEEEGEAEAYNAERATEHCWEREMVRELGNAPGRARQGRIGEVGQNR